MVSRIDLGPDGGPYVEIDEDAGDLVIRVPSNTVDFDSNDLVNAVLQNATMDGGSLDGVSLASALDADTQEIQNANLQNATLSDALDANNQDLNSVGTASVTALEAGRLNNIPQSITAELGDDQPISERVLTDLNWSNTRRQTNPEVDLSDFEDYDNDGFSVPSDPDFNEMRLSCAINIDTRTTLRQFCFQQNGSTNFEGNERFEGNINNCTSMMIQTAWVEINAGDVYTVSLELDDDRDVNDVTRTYYKMEVR